MLAVGSVGQGRRQLTLGAAVGVHGPYQYELRRRVRDIAEDVEEVELHHARCMQPLSLWLRRRRRLHSARPAACCLLSAVVRGSAAQRLSHQLGLTSVACRRAGAMQGMLLRVLCR